MRTTCCRLLKLAIVAGSAACAGRPAPAVVMPAPARAASAPPLDRAAIEAVMGRTGTELAGGVLRFGMPRSDLDVRVGTVQIRPTFALGSWLAFKAVPGGAIAMGDMVLLDTELAPVLSSLQAGGIEQTAIHHHLVGESPRILYMHVHGMGDPTRIATAVRAALALTGTPAPAAPQAIPATATRFPLDTAAIAATLGWHGTVNGGVLQVGVPRAETIRDAGTEIPPSMGLATAINFEPTGDGRAAITGDFVLLGGEVNPVIRVLQAHGITVTSLHSHLLMEEPRLYFMHFWANEDALRLATGLRAALDSTNSRRAP